MQRQLVKFTKLPVRRHFLSIIICATRDDVPLRIMLTILFLRDLPIQSETLSVDRLTACRVTLDTAVPRQKRAPSRFLARTMRFLLGAILDDARRQ